MVTVDCISGLVAGWLVTVDCIRGTGNRSMYCVVDVVTAVARKEISVILPKVQVQVSAKHSCILRMWLRIKYDVNWCVVVWYTERAPRRQQFY